MSKKQDQPPAPDSPPFAEYQNITDAPVLRRRLDEVPLSVEQMNWINERAWALREERTAEDRVSPEGETVKGGTFWVENRQAAYQEFREAFEIEGGLWVQKKGAVN